MEILEKYVQELEEFYKLDETNLTDKQMKLPSMKHRFVGIYIREKINLEKLIKQRKKLFRNIKKTLEEKSAVKLSDAKLEEIALTHADIISFDDKIEDSEMIIKFCDKVEKILSNMTFDFKNLAELKKMEMI